jgi:ubiquitin fusion degradation protein 1
MMQTLLLEPGDLLQTKSTDLPPGQFIKLQPQDTNFLDISDPKAVLETAFRNFSCLTQGDIFTFLYNETTYEIAVLEVKPQGEKKAVSVQETDIEVDFAPPVGYVEPSRTAASGTSTPRSIGTTMAGKGGTMHTEGNQLRCYRSFIRRRSNRSRKGFVQLLWWRSTPGGEEGWQKHRNTGLNSRHVNTCDSAR